MDEVLQGAVLVLIPNTGVCPKRSPQMNIFCQVGKLVYIRCTALVTIQSWEEVEVIKHFVLLLQCLHLSVDSAAAEEWWKMREKQREGVEEQPVTQL